METVIGQPSSVAQNKSRVEMAGLVDTLRHKLPHLGSNDSLCAGQAGLYRGSLVRAVLREIHSLLWRIREIRRTQSHRRGISINPLPEKTWPPALRESALTCCMRDTHSLSASRQHLTLTEVELFVRGWEAGAEWYARNCGTESRAAKP
jgi:hypothetical protein